MDPRAGQAPRTDQVVDLTTFAKLVDAYHDVRPEPAIGAHGWYAARPSGTANIYKIYAESFRGEHHLRRIVTEAQRVVDCALADPGGRTSRGDNQHPTVEVKP